MANFLVTGIAGFIGSAASATADFRKVDLLDVSATNAACSGVDYVLHEAAIASVPRSVDPDETKCVNVDGTVNRRARCQAR